MGNTCLKGKRRFRSTGAFLNNSAIVFKLIWIKETNLWCFEICTSFFSKKYVFCGRPKYVYKCNWGNYNPPMSTQFVLSAKFLMGHSYEACSSIKHNGSGYQLLYNSHHTLGTHWHLDNKPLLLENTKKYVYFDRTARQNASKNSYWRNQVNKCTFFKEIVRNPVWICRDPFSLILGTRFFWF